MLKIKNPVTVKKRGNIFVISRGFAYTFRVSRSSYRGNCGGVQHSHTGIRVCLRSKILLTTDVYL